jgi:LCP family protein required for cell wall assembly
VIGRIARALVALLAATTGLAGIYSVGLQWDRRDAPVVLQAVEPTTLRAGYQPDPWSSTVFLLALGSDERAGLGGARTDAVHLIGLNPKTKQATILNFPRDTWVDIPGHGQGRINSAYTFGGAQLAAQTVGQLVGLPIGYVMVTTFDGLKAMVDGLGGVSMNVPYLMSDPNSGAALDPGQQMLNGYQALAFSRNRHIPGGDIARAGHQGQLIINALGDLRFEGTDLTGALHALDVLYRNVRVDGISAKDMLRLSRAALGVDIGNVRNYTVPVVGGFKGAASVQFLSGDWGGLFADFRDDAVLQNH